MEWSQGQLAAITEAKRIAQEGGLVYLTGKGGTGKSAVVGEIVEQVERTVLLATTGIAAVLIGGQTWHSFFGVKPGSLSAAMRDSYREVLESARLIIIDEVSMCRADSMDIIDKAMRLYLGVDKPFGGKGVMLVGDHWQIEPVVSPEESHLLKDYSSPWFFDSKVWNSAGGVMVELTEVFRQVGEGADEFKAALNDIRSGGVQGLPFFNTRVGRADKESVKLCYTNKRAAALNATELDKLDSRLETLRGVVSGDFTKDYPTGTCDIDLKVGARVMILTNDRLEGHCNGDTGTLLTISSAGCKVLLDRGDREVTVLRATWEKRVYELDKDTNEIVSKVVASFSQVPLKLAYAVTVHKSQGQTYDKCHLELDTRAFASGLLYVALSRCRTVDGLTLTRPIRPNDNNVSSRVLQWVGR